MAELNKDKERQDAKLALKDKEAKRTAEDEEFERRRAFWSAQKNVRKMNNSVDSRSIEIAESPSIVLTDVTKKSFGVESGNFFNDLLK